MARTAKIDSAARKARNVLVRENDVLMARREKYITKTLSAAEREKRLAMARQMQREAIQEKAKAKQEDIARIQQQKEERQEAHRTAVEEAQQRREARMRDFQEQKRKELENLKSKREKRRAQMAAIRDKAAAAEGERRKLALEKIAKAEENRKRIEEERAAAVAARREEKRLQFEAKTENAERVRSMIAARKAKKVAKMQAAYQRMETLKVIRESIRRERQEKWKLDKTEKDWWLDTTTLQRNIEPGPGEYEPAPLPTAGGTWGKHKPKSDIEWQIHRAKQMPGPGSYKLPSTLTVPGGTWGKHSGKSYIEWEVYRASKMPDPGEYNPKALPSGFAVTFGDHNPPSDVDLLMRWAKDTPAPGDFQPRRVDPDIPSFSSLQASLGARAQKHNKGFSFTGGPSKLSTTFGNPSQTMRHSRSAGGMSSPMRSSSKLKNAGRVGTAGAPG
jgi:chemotaxis protein histidine kinase CheA